MTRPRRRSAALDARLRISRERAAAARARAAGLTEPAYRTALVAACLAWCARRPWRWLPVWVGELTFTLFGRSVAARFVAEWASGGTDGQG